MAIIALVGIEVFSPLGFYEEERILNSKLRIDTYINTTESLIKTKLENTINYEVIHNFILKESKVECKLLEDLLYRILYRLKEYFQKNPDVKVCSIKCRVTKKTPPLPGAIEAVFLEDEFIF